MDAPPPIRMSDRSPQLPVVLLWHMHQPDYRVEGSFHLPWVYLHGLGAYTDMAAHFEAVEGARAVVNFSPVLLDQIDDYARRLNADPTFDTPLGDPLLDALRVLPPPGATRAQIVRRCLPVHRNRRTERHAEFGLLVVQAELHAAESLPDGLLADLLMRFHLNWLGESLREDPRAQRLLAQRESYDAADRLALLSLIADALAALLPRWRALADRGRVELSMTPQSHPLLPLLLAFSSAADTAPGVTLPAAPYPKGEERARWHLLQGRRRFAELLGREPQGCWPSEAALSQETLALLDSLGFTWAASSGSVLANTLGHAGCTDLQPFSAWQVPGQRLRCHFRDDGLSDRIGFAYKDWHADDAVADLVTHVERIAHGNPRELLIALDGENAWEYYPDNGIHFIRGLYRALSSHPRLRLATLGESASAPQALPPLRAGSWVHGQLLTWIGHSEKNRAWSLLIAARRRFLAHPHPSLAAQYALAACEGSDWFWWPGAENPPSSVSDFDALFRAHLSSLYRALGESPPAELSRPFAQGATAAVVAGGVMRATDSVEAPWIERCAGVLLDLHALPSAKLDTDALRFADLIAKAGLRVWQMLPIGPRDQHANPFQPSSAFAGDTDLLADDTQSDEPSYATFEHDNADWLDDWALFVALKAREANRHWWDWPRAIRDRQPEALAAARLELAEPMQREKRQQHRFETSWARFKHAANARGLRLFGDVPLFVSHDSADVWGRRELFELDANGHCVAVVGVPPDAFSAEGQWWGSVPYRWEVIAAQDYAWWKRRFQVQARRFDLLRVDHFRGLAAWWRIPGEAISAKEGAWIEGPGAAALDALVPVLAGTRLVAEDLGIITDDVVALRKGQRIPGMRVLQFAFDGDPRNPHLPAEHAPDSVCYTGTHDNDTSLGWWRTLSEAEQDAVRDTLVDPLSNMPQDFVDIAWRSPAPLAIVPMQDLLGLGSETRTNVPGVAEGNWRWRFSWSQIPAAFAALLRVRLLSATRASDPGPPL